MKRLTHILLSGLLFVIQSAPVNAYQESDLGNLFFTVQERKRIDDQRSGKVVEKVRPQVVHRVSVKGFVKRSDGKNVVWTNNGSTLSKKPIHNVTVHERSINKKNQVGLTIDGKWVRLKPGESWQSEQ